MQRVPTGMDVFHQALQRIVELYEQGHRLVVTFSAGKDSTCTLELTLLAARMTGNLPVTVVMRDDEIMYPGTFEYAERVAERPEVDFRWVYARQPVINVFNREAPYFWAFDPQLPPDRWVRQPPSIAYEIANKNIQGITSKALFPPPEGRDLFVLMGVRAQESIIRSCSVISAGGHLTKANPFGARHCRPIYDWTDGDVWRAIGTNRWDYNHAYDVFHRHGMPARKLRIAPPSQSPAGADQIRIAQQAWPSWFDRVDERLPGFRAIAHYGPKAVQPHRRAGETWEECFTRVCMVEAPKWIAARAELARGRMLKAHRAHATTPFPERETCNSCNASTNSWRKLTQAMFLGDPFAQKASFLPYVEPEFFRLGAGTWGGNPAA